MSVYFQAFSFLLAHKHLQLMQILASISHNSTFISLQSHTNILSKPHKYAGSDLTSFCWLLWPRDKSLKSIPKRWATAVDILNLSAHEGIYIFFIYVACWKRHKDIRNLKQKLGARNSVRGEKWINKLFHIVWTLWHF